MTNPLKAIFAAERREVPLAVLMFSYFFLVITSFWILKPIKKSLFIQFYDASGFTIFGWHMLAAQAELLAKVMNMIVAIGAVVVFSWLSRSFRRQQLTYIFSGFFVACHILYSFLLTSTGDAVVWSFYLYGDLFSTLMVATFFVFLNDSVTPDAAKRLYGLIGLGGVAGGVFGASALRLWINRFSNQEWLFICAGIAVVIIVLAAFAGKAAGANRIADETASVHPVSEAPAGNSAFEGAMLVFNSRYLLAIAAVVGLYEIISTLLDFQFTTTISHYLDGAGIGRQFSTVFAITNWVSMFVQLFLTGFVMTRFGVLTALMVLPAAIFLGSVGFLVLPVLWVGSLLNTADNGFSYSINQSAKEALYVPTTTDEKYKAKAFIDMFVQRFAKSVAVGVSLAVTAIFVHFESVRFLSLLTVALTVVWFLAARYAGRKFAEFAN